MVDEEYLSSLETSLAEQREKNVQLSTALSSTNYQGGEDKNPIEYQLDPQDFLSKIEHFLRGDFLKADEDGGEAWHTQTDTDLILFNDLGVSAIMVIIGSYFDKNTVLSRYDEMRINEILSDLGDALTRFIFCNYEKMGMDTPYKKSRYEVIVLMILHNIESAYRRAIQGKTSEDINTSKIFTQSDNLGRGGIGGLQGPLKAKFNFFKPRTW